MRDEKGSQNFSHIFFVYFFLTGVLYRDQGALVIHCPLNNNKDGLFEEGTWNAEIIDELKPEPNDVILQGRSDFSAFRGTGLEEILESHRITKLYLAGFLTEGSIADTVSDAFELELIDNGLKVYVVKDGIVAETNEQIISAVESSLPMFCEAIVPARKASEMIRRDSNPNLQALIEKASNEDDTSERPLVKGQEKGHLETPGPKDSKARRRFTMFDSIKALRVVMADKWLAGDRFVRFLDRDSDGKVSYDEFYDFMNQFGLVQEARVDPARIFSILDVNGTGEINTHELLEALTPQETDFDDEEPIEFQRLPPFPSPFLVALVAHNNMKPSMIKFVKDHLKFFSRVKLVTTGSTGRSLAALGLNVEHLVSSGPLGGDQEIGGLIAGGKVVAVFFFTDPLSAHPHAPDISALNRICCVHDIMFANNPSTANALVYSLEHSIFGYSKLIGLNPEIGSESSVVAKYKEGQAKVIQTVSDGAVKAGDGRRIQAAR